MPASLKTNSSVVAGSASNAVAPVILDTSNPPTGWFGLWGEGDLLTVRNVENEGDYGIYLIRKLIWKYSGTYTSYIEVQVEPISGVVIIGSTSWSIGSTYSFSFAKKGQIN